MILVTSLSPTHKNKEIQQSCIDSWIKSGLSPVSLNSPKEFDGLKEYKNIEVKEASKTMEHLYGKPYLSLDAIFDYAARSNDDYFMICNSDINIQLEPEELIKIYNILDYGILCVNRVDYEETFSDGEPYVLGIDVVFFHKKFLHIFPRNKFALGQCHWDYWMPYRAAKNRVPLYFLMNKIAYHKMHNTQYTVQDWMKTGRLFIAQEKLRRFSSRVGHMSEYVYRYFMSNSKKVKI